MRAETMHAQSRAAGAAGRAARTTLAILTALAALAAAAAPVAAQRVGCASPGPFAGGDCDGGVHSMTILGMPISPRAVALGEAMGAIDRDPAALWYNAAGIAGLDRNAFTVTASQRFAQTQLVGAAVAFPTTFATFGIAARGFNAGTIENRVQGEPSGGSTRAYQFALEGGGAIQLARWWRWGGTLVYSQEALGSSTQGSVGLNSGMQFPEIWKRLTVDGGVRNFGTRVNFAEGFKGFNPPLYGYAGAGIDLMRQHNLMQTPMLFRGQPIVFDAKLVGQANFPDRDEPYFGVGVESTVNGVAILRLGYQTGNDNRAGISLGAGVNVGQFRLEYAFRNYHNGGAGFFTNDPLGDSHNVSFSYFWGEQRKNEQLAVPVIVAQPLDTAKMRAIIDSAVRNIHLPPGNVVLVCGDSTTTMPAGAQRIELPASACLRDITRYIVPVHFGFDTALTVRDEDRPRLDTLSLFLQQPRYATALVTVEGFADPAGSVSYNQLLSHARACSVRDYLLTRGIPASIRMRTAAYDKQQNRQVVLGARRDDPGAEQNRRVTFTIDASESSTTVPAEPASACEDVLRSWRARGGK